jgi:hypothetical protein
MHYLKLFFIYARIILEARKLLVLVGEYCPEKVEALVRKLYRYLPEKGVDEETFVNNFVKYLKLIQALVDIVWLISPRIMHYLTWKYLDLERSGWKWFSNTVQKYVDQVATDLEQCIEYYTHVYNREKLGDLLRKDFEIQLQKFDYVFQEMIRQEINREVKKYSSQVNPDGNWIYSIDENGIHENPNWDINK